jgi:hypothetical protein
MRTGRRGEIGRGRAAIALFLPCVVFSTAPWSLVMLFVDINYPGIQIPNWLGYLFYGSFPVLLVVSFSIAIYWSEYLTELSLPPS